MAADKKQKASDQEAKPEKGKMEKSELPVLKTGMTVRVHQLISEKGPKGDKQRIQVYEGMIIAHKHGLQPGATITVRKVSDGVGVEKIFPLHSPNVVKIEPVKQAKTRQSKLYYLRTSKKRLKEAKLN